MLKIDSQNVRFCTSNIVIYARAQFILPVIYEQGKSAHTICSRVLFLHNNNVYDNTNVVNIIMIIAMQSHCTIASTHATE